MVIRVNQVGPYICNVTHASNNAASRVINVEGKLCESQNMEFHPVLCRKIRPQWCHCHKSGNCWVCEPTVPVIIQQSIFVDGMLTLLLPRKRIHYLDGSLAGTAMVFSLTDLQNATNNFSTDELIAEGGFGKVYRGRLRYWCSSQTTIGCKI